MKSLSIFTLAAISALSLSGCMTVNSFKATYQPLVIQSSLEHAAFLREGQQPVIEVTTNIKNDVYNKVSNGFVLLGHSSFNAPLESISNVVEQAVSLGATHVLTQSDYTNTEISTHLKKVSDKVTLIKSEQLNSKFHVDDSYGPLENNSPCNRCGAHEVEQLTSSATAYVTRTVPYMVTKRRYDQKAYYFVKSLQKNRFGFKVTDLPLDAAIELERNTGALVSLIYKRSPAFFAGIIPSDIIVRVNQTNIADSQHLLDILSNYPANSKQCVITILRNNREIEISLAI